MPDIRRLDFGQTDQLEQITERTAAVVIEPIQAEGGVVIPSKQYMQRLRQKCDEKGCLLIFDEVQTGFGRTGKLFAFEHFDIVPDILVIAKAAGGGMPLGAFIADKKIMDVLAKNPPLGHITTFGGHPVSAAAGYAALKVLLHEKIIDTVPQKGQMFIDLLKDHPKIKNIRGIGLLIGVQLFDAEQVTRLMDIFVKNGLMTDRFLFARDMFRIGPPLIITEEQIRSVVEIIRRSLDEL